MDPDLLDLLLALDGIQQDPRWHPERDALYHSLQAFDLARRETDDRDLLAAALLHDVGKALGSKDHAETGADLIDGLVAPRVVWLVRHHLCLLEAPGATKRRFRGTPQLADLQRLRRWDVRGRSPHASVLSAEAALDILLGGGALDVPSSARSLDLSLPLSPSPAPLGHADALHHARKDSR